MSVLKKFVKWFLYITTGILIVTCIIFALYDADALPKNTLWHILLSGFLTTGVTVLFCPEETGSKWRTSVGVILHYISLCVVMVVCGNWFGWIRFDLPGIALMFGAVAVVYLISFITYYIVDMKQAEAINQRLKEKYGDEE